MAEHRVVRQAAPVVVEEPKVSEQTAVPREKVAYQEGCADGHREGYEEGFAAAVRHMQPK